MGDSDIQKLIQILTDEAPLHTELLKAMINRLKRGGNSVVTVQNGSTTPKARAIQAFMEFKKKSSDETKLNLEIAEHDYYISIFDMAEDVPTDEKEFQNYILEKLKASTIELETRVSDSSSQVGESSASASASASAELLEDTPEVAATVDATADETPVDAPEETAVDAPDDTAVDAPEEAAVDAPEETAVSIPSQGEREVNGNNTNAFKVDSPVPEGFVKNEFEDYGKLSTNQQKNYMRMKPVIGINKSVNDWQNVMEVARKAHPTEKKAKQVGGVRHAVTPIGKNLHISFNKNKASKTVKADKSQSPKKSRKSKKTKHFNPSKKKSRKSKA